MSKKEPATIQLAVNHQDYFRMNPTAKFLTNAVCIFIASITLIGCGGAGDVSTLLEKADAAIENGKLAEAESILRFAFREEKENPEILSRMGDIYVKQGRLRDAFQMLNAAIRLDPNDSKSLTSLASIKLAAGMREDALVDARKALELDPEQGDAPILLAELTDSIEAAARTKEWLESFPPTPAIHAAIGSLFLKSRNVAMAEAQFKKAIELDPSSPIGYTGSFQILLIQGKNEEAVSTLEQAAKLAPYRSPIRLRHVQVTQQLEGDEPAYALLEEILDNAPDYLPALSLASEYAAKMGNNEAAHDLVKRALALDPIDPTAMRVYGTLLVLEEKFEDAVKQLQKAIDLYPGDIRSNYQMALAYLAQGTKDKAKSHLAMVVSSAPTHLESNILLATIQIDEGDFSGSIITLRTFLESSPNSVQAYLMLAEAYNRNGNNEAALAIYSKLEELSPENPQFDYLSGISQLRNRNSSEARSAFESALDANPLHLQSVEQLTALDLREQNFEAALARIEQTISASPETSVLHTIKAQILQAQGKTNEAKESYEKSIELAPDSITARTLYARLLIASGGEALAITQLEAILETNPEHIGTLISLSSINERAKRFEAAAEIYERILKIDDSNLAALNNLAYLNSTYFNKLEEAFELAKRAREEAPNSPYTGDTLGWIVYKKGDYDWALSLLADAYTKLPGNPEVAYHLASTHYMLGNSIEAADLLEIATSSETQYLGFDDALAKAEILSIDSEAADSAAISRLEARIDSEPNDIMAILKRADVLRIQNKIEEAKQAYRKALTLVPENTLAMISMGEVYFTEGAFEEAQELAQKAIAQKTDNADATFLLGNIALSTGQFTWATSLLQGLVGNYPEEELFLALGQAHYQLGNSENAINRLQSVLSSDSSEQRKEKAKILKRILEIDTNLPSESNRDFLEAQISEAGNDAQAIATLATLTLREGAIEQAEANFERALEISSENKLAKLGLSEILTQKSENPSRAYSLAGPARNEPLLQNRATALQAISLFNQDKMTIAQSLLESVDLEKLPTSLRDQLAKLME